MAEAGGYVAAVRKASIFRWSLYTTTVQLTAVATNLALPSITMGGMPDNATVTYAQMLLKARKIENTNALANYVSGAQNLQALLTGGSTWTTGIALSGGEFAVGASSSEAGDVMMGSEDISAQIPANGIVITFQWALALAAQANLNFIDVQTGIRVDYQV